MFRISRLTDYSIVLLGHMARHGDRVHTAASLAEASGVSLPTVSKLLKMLARAQITRSLRGAHGGYVLARDAAQITLADIISVLEGSIALTECSSEVDACRQQACDLRGHWDVINRAVRSALQSVTLADLAAPREGALVEHKVSVDSIGIWKYRETHP